MDFFLTATGIGLAICLVLTGLGLMSRLMESDTPLIQTTIIRTTTIHKEKQTEDK